QLAPIPSAITRRAGSKSVHASSNPAATSRAQMGMPIRPSPITPTRRTAVTLAAGRAGDGALSAGELLKLGERLGLEQSAASVHALATGLLANRAVAMVRSVARAFLGAVRACPDAGLQQTMNHVVIPVSWPRKDASGYVAHIGARHAERGARAHRGNVVLR